MPAIGGRLRAALALVLAMGSLPFPASAQGATGTNLVIRLRLAGDADALPPLRTCLVDKLSQMPDVKVVTAPAEGVRFIVDLVAAKGAKDTASVSVVVAQTFPMEQFSPRMKEGESNDALLTSIRYYTLLRLHQLLPAANSDELCSSIAADIDKKVLSKEYTERND